MKATLGSDLIPKQLELPLPEPLVTFTAAARTFGVPIFKIRRAAKAGTFSVYRIGNGRALARLTEVVAAIERSGSGDNNV